MTFLKKVENIAGTSNFDSNSAYTTYKDMISEFLTESARAVLDVLPDKVLIKDSIQISIEDNTGVDVTDKKIVKVNREGYGCVEMPLEEKAHLEAGSGSIKEPTRRSPVYYIEGQASTGGKLFIKPNPASNQKGTLDYSGYPSVAWNNSSITNFPDLAEYAVVIGSALRLLQHKMNLLIHDDEDIELAQVVQQELLNVSEMYKDEIMRLNGQMGKVTDGNK